MICDVSLTLPKTNLSVGLVDCGICTTTQSLCEDEVSQFWWSKTGS